MLTVIINGLCRMIWGFLVFFPLLAPTIFNIVNIIFTACNLLFKINIT